MNKGLLTIRNLSFRWSTDVEPLFFAISCDFAPGTVSALMGLNGAGKTTLLEVISQRLASARSSVEIDGRPAQKEDFNYLPQESSRLLFSHLTLLENISIRRIDSFTGVPPTMMPLFKGDDVLSRYPSQCSGGQRQRAVICRAVLDMPNFPVTLLDESFSSLSHEAKTLVALEMRRVARECGATVIFVSHDVVDAMRFGDRVLTLADGCLQIFDMSEINGEKGCSTEMIIREKILSSLHITGQNI